MITVISFLVIVLTVHDFLFNKMHHVIDTESHYSFVTRDYPGELPFSSDVVGRIFDNISDLNTKLQLASVSKLSRQLLLRREHTLKKRCLELFLSDHLVRKGKQHTARTLCLSFFHVAKFLVNQFENDPFMSRDFIKIFLNRYLLFNPNLAIVFDLYGQKKWICNILDFLKQQYFGTGKFIVSSRNNHTLELRLNVDKFLFILEEKVSGQQKSVSLCYYLTRDFRDNYVYQNKRDVDFTGYNKVSLGIFYNPLWQYSPGLDYGPCINLPDIGEGIVNPHSIRQLSIQVNSLRESVDLISRLPNLKRLLLDADCSSMPRGLKICRGITAFFARPLGRLCYDDIALFEEKNADAKKVPHSQGVYSEFVCPHCSGRGCVENESILCTCSDEDLWQGKDCDCIFRQRLNQMYIDDIVQ